MLVSQDFNSNNNINMKSDNQNINFINENNKNNNNFFLNNISQLPQEQEAQEIQEEAIYRFYINDKKTNISIYNFHDTIKNSD